MGQKLRILWLIVYFPQGITCTTRRMLSKSLGNCHRKQIIVLSLSSASIVAFECEFIHCQLQVSLLYTATSNFLPCLSLLVNLSSIYMYVLIATAAKKKYKTKVARAPKERTTVGIHFIASASTPKTRQSWLHI